MNDIVEKPKRVRNSTAKSDTNVAKKAVVKKVVVKKVAVKPKKKPRQPMPVYEIIDSEYDNPWTFHNVVFNSSNIGKSHGFIYLIEEISSGRVYIGQKHFWTTRPRMVNGKKRKIKCEGDWKTYYSSSNYINLKFEKEGGSDFKRSVIALIGSDGMLNYIEMKLQMDCRVLEQSDKFINGYIGGRISTPHYKAEMLFEVDNNILNKLYELSYTGFKR